MDKIDENAKEEDDEIPKLQSNFEEASKQ